MGFSGGYIVSIKKRVVTGFLPVSTLFLSLSFSPSLSSFNTLQISQSVKKGVFCLCQP